MRPGRPSHFKGAWAILREACGGTDKLAEELGVHPVVVQKWALHGRTPRAAARKAIEKLAKEKGVPNPLTAPAGEETSEGTSEAEDLLDAWLIASGQRAPKN